MSKRKWMISLVGGAVVAATAAGVTGANAAVTPAPVAKAVAVKPAPGPAAATKKAVTMTFAVSPSSVRYTWGAHLTGKAANGTTGNGGVVDIYFMADGATTYTKILSTRTTAAGAFSAWDVGTLDEHRVRTGVTKPGTYKAVYLGNAQRQSATRTAKMTVFSYVVAGLTPTHPFTGAGLCEPGQPATECVFTTATVPVRPGILRGNYEFACNARADLTKKMVVAYLPKGPNTKPVPGPATAYRQVNWVELPISEAATSGSFELSALTLDGHFFVKSVDNCSWDIRIIELHDSARSRR
ncbi:hypothetical protein [Actinoplanes sp. URMC 104]|uniref:hypothetical protein n=1 Tax=Actinoplanes sp. URMC 104 TaxID=3423409 RepID=UPI003F19FE94